MNSRKVNSIGDLEGLEGKSIRITYSFENQEKKIWNLKVKSVSVNPRGGRDLGSILGYDGKRYAVYSGRTTIEII